MTLFSTNLQHSTIVDTTEKFFHLKPFSKYCCVVLCYFVLELSIPMQMIDSVHFFSSEKFTSSNFFPTKTNTKPNFILFRIYHSNTNVLVIFWLQIAALMFIRNMFIKWKNCALVPILLPRHPLLPMFRLSPRKVTRKAWCLVLPESSRKENYPVGNRRLRQQPHRRPRWPPTTGLKVSFWCIHTPTYVHVRTLLIVYYSYDICQKCRRLQDFLSDHQTGFLSVYFI